MNSYILNITQFIRNIATNFQVEIDTTKANSYYFGFIHQNNLQTNVK